MYIHTQRVGRKGTLLFKEEEKRCIFDDNFAYYSFGEADLRFCFRICKKSVFPCYGLYCSIGPRFQILNEPRCEKTVFGVSDQVRYKPGCTATEDG